MWFKKNQIPFKNVPKVKIIHIKHRLNCKIKRRANVPKTSRRFFYRKYHEKVPKSLTSRKKGNNFIVK